MNLNDLYEMRDPRDAYERDVANSTSGFGKDSQAYRTDGGANDENHALDQKSSTWYIRLNGKLIRDKSGNPYAFQNKAAANKAALTMQAKLFNKDKEFMLTTNPNDKQQGVEEGSQRVDSLVADALKIMRGAGLNDAVQALKTVLGDREYNDRRNYYNFYVKQLMDMYSQQGVTEGHTEVKDKQGKVVSWKDDSEWHPAEKNKQGQPKDPRGVVTHLSDVARRKTAKQQDMAEGAEFGANYAEQLAQKVFNVRPKLAGDDDILNIGYKIAVQDLMSQVRANHLFARDQDFPSDFVTAYSYLQKQGMMEAKVDSDGHSVDHADSGEYDYEGDQAKDQLNTIVRAARRLDGMLDDNENMPEWVQMKITNAADYIDTAADYIESNQEPELEEGERGRGRPPSNTQDTTPVTPGRVEKTATGIRHHADASRYGGTEPDDDEDDHLMSKSHISRLGKMTEPDIDEGWRETLGAAALTGAMALGAGGAQARVMPGDDPGINRLTGKPIATQQATDTAPTQSTSSINLAKPQAQYDVDTRILTYKGKQYKWNSDAQATGQGEVVTAPSIAVGSRSMGSTKVELNPNGTYTRAPANESQEKVGNMDADEFDSAMARLKQLAGAGPMKTVYDPTKRVYRNVPVAVQPKK